MDNVSSSRIVTSMSYGAGENLRHQSLLALGSLVRPVGSRIGTGKVVKFADGLCVVEFFHSISRTELHTYRPDDLVPVPLARQTRCYVREPESLRWTAGRIGTREALTYEVHFPDKRTRWLSESEIYVRCNVPCPDPTETLVLKSHETARFHAPRLALVKALVRQRAVSRGLTALTSARIELFAHQVEVVRRVLEDPVQRYLLADEVGLGKTIEAGILIRQFLLDEPEGDVIVLVPGLLLDQWRRELDSRFSALETGRVHVVSTAELEEVSADLHVGMFVVDEAHHVAAGAVAADPVALANFEACRHLAHSSERVILLSATPAANNEAQFLAMLHLLDPQTYRLEDVDAFRERVRMRQEIGRLLLTVTEEARPFSLKLNLPKIAALFPEDERLAELSSEVLRLVESDPTDTLTRAEKIRAIRTHVSETYRLHRRMLRNRRSTIADAIHDRGNQRLVVTRGEGEEYSVLDDALDDWRTLVATAVRRAEDSGDAAPRREDFRQIFFAFVETADGSPRLLSHLVRWRLHADAEACRAVSEELPLETIVRMREAPLVDGEAQLLEHLLLAAESTALADHRMRALEELLAGLRLRAGRATPPRCVVFTSFADTARQIASRLEKVLGPGRVARHIAGLSRETVEEGVKRFRESYDCFVLVCDRTAEEGRNLQFADRLIHFDLPFHPNRLEQRIGRVDRVNRVRDLMSHVLLGHGEANSVSEAWYRLLSEGLGLFETSIASLQFYVDDRLPRLRADAFRAGAHGVIEQIPTVRAEIDAERERIEEQAAIDEIDARDENAAEFFSAMDDADADYPSLQRAVEGWLCDALQFVRQPDGRLRSALRYVALDRTLVPSDVLATRFRPFTNRAGTYDRTTAARNPDVALYRLGEGLIESLSDYVAWDDRGQAFAIWREDSDWDAREGSEWVGFRFDLVAEAETTNGRHVLSRLTTGRATLKSLDRRADALFPPRTESIFVDLGLNEIADSELLQRLRRPFSKYRTSSGLDYNLTKHRLAAIEHVLPDGAWERVCRDARDAALSLLRSRPTFRERCERYAAQAEKRLGIHLEQLRLRALRGSPVAAHEIEIEAELCEALVTGIRAPRLRVDSAGFIVMSGRGPLDQRPDLEGDSHV